jgi:L-lactate dehydrogenase complex protein LldE
VRVSLFVTCLVDLVRPSAGEAAVRVLRRAGHEVAFPAGQTCCGQPAWNSGYPDEARRVAATMLDALASSTGPIVGLSGSCVATVSHVWPELFRADVARHAQALDVASRIRELGAFLADGSEPADDAQVGRPVAFHCSCHQRRELGEAGAGPALIAALPGVSHAPVPQDELCCGFGGTFSVKFPQVSGAMGRDKARTVVESGASELVSGDLGCLLHIQGCADAEGIAITTTTLAEFLDREGYPQAAG